MKKFFSLVLALVMALSLTTVAWGAECVGCTHEAAIGDTHYDTLTLAIFAANPGQTVTMLKDVTVTSPLVVNGITLDGGDNSLIADAALGGLANAGYTDNHSVIRCSSGCTIKNLTIDGGFKAILVSSAATQDILLDNVTIVKSCRAFNITESSSGVASANLTVKNSTLAGWNSFSTTGTVVFENCEFVVNASERGNGLNPRNDMTATNCVFEDGFEMNFEDLDASDSVSFVDCVYDGEPLTEDNFADFADDTYYDADVHAVAATFTGVAYNVYDANGKLAVANTMYTAHDGSYNKKTATGTVDYYTIADMAGKFVECAKADADYYVTFVGQDGAILYLAEVPYVNYTMAKAYSNIGTECGQLPGNDAKNDYFTYSDANGVPYYFVETAAGATEALMVNGELVFVKAAGTTVPHTWKVKTVNAKHEVTELVCEECDVVATVYATKLAAPAGAVKDATYGWISINAPATSTDKVTSAETFDAGIAMYVGMSVMAAAGSAVVLKKKD